MTHSFALPEDDPDRLAELGRIAGGLVHELKNPLAVILMNAELILDSAPFREALTERSTKRVQRIVDSARNVQQIIQSFLAFAGPGRLDPEAVDINALLNTVLDEQHELMQQAQVKVHRRLDGDLCLLAADRQHLRAAFTNIITNAREALLDRADHRSLVVFTRHSPGMVRVVVANNGPPLSENVAAHLFEPFHSTKESGTGLGLAIVRRLVELHHGTVTVSSDPDQGVSFTFEFPTSLGPARLRTALPIPLTQATVRASEPAPAFPASSAKTSRPRRPRRQGRT